MLKKVQLRAPEGAEYSILFAGDFCPREENGPYVAENAEKIIIRKPGFAVRAARLWKHRSWEQIKQTIKH